MLNMSDTPHVLGAIIIGAIIVLISLNRALFAVNIGG